MSSQLLDIFLIIGNLVEAGRDQEIGVLGIGICGCGGFTSRSSRMLSCLLNAGHFGIPRNLTTTNEIRPARFLIERDSIRH